jgi:hypothetical protein
MDGAGREWTFAVPSAEMDIAQLYSMVAALEGSEAYRFMGDLKRHAPVAYRRLQLWCVRRKLLAWWHWEPGARPIHPGDR